ncbi:hypothetical protein N9F36_07995, partial [Akkermansiaceae bacterium]|nr:hypothetical protein [Akkermansiaceae bacterium]
ALMPTKAVLFLLKSSTHVSATTADTIRHVPDTAALALTTDLDPSLVKKKKKKKKRKKRKKRPAAKKLLVNNLT